MRTLDGGLGLERSEGDVIVRWAYAFFEYTSFQPTFCTVFYALRLIGFIPVELATTARDNKKQTGRVAASVSVHY
jgi:hypothetical protein